MTAYTGGRLMLGNFYYPVVVDLSGLKVSAKSRPILRDHDASQIVGHTDSVTVNAGNIRVEGTVSASNEHAREVAESADNGFPWQASIGARAGRMVFVDKGESVEVNGRKFTGPVYVARQSTLGEVSFVALGADDNTSARMVAGATTSEGVVSMKFEKWLEAKGFTLEALDEDTTNALRAMFDAEQAAAGDADDEETVQAAAGNDGASTGGEVESGVAAIEAAAIRINEINAACDGHPDIAAQAIAGHWDVDRCKTQIELKELRAARPTAPAVHTNNGGADRMQVIQAGLLLACDVSGEDAIKDTSEQAVEAAQKQFRGGIGLQEVILEAAIANGYMGRRIRSVAEDTHNVMRAAFSTTSLSGILGNTANKAVGIGFNAVESAWRSISAIRPVNDFKTVTSYSLTGAMQYDQVGPDGQLKHGSVGEQSYTNQADTYGKMFAITRKNIINDDLALLTQVPRKIGRGAALKLNDVFWTEFLDNSTFFASGNSNYISGSTTSLDVDSLTTGETTFLNQTDPDGKPLGATPAILLVPTALKTTATQLYNDTQLRDTTASKVRTVGNPHAGNFTPVYSTYLSNSSYTGYSTTAWYLLADPEDIPVIEVAFLNGNEMPTVESADADFNTLGIQYRGYHDFGVNKQEYRGGMKSKGAA